MGRTTLYHRTEPPRIVDGQDAIDALLAQGWADTPAAFYMPEMSVPEKPARAKRKEPSSDV